ncbi:unnamed protein product [Caretta caretta]
MGGGFWLCQSERAVQSGVGRERLVSGCQSWRGGPADNGFRRLGRAVSGVRGRLSGRGRLGLPAGAARSSAAERGLPPCQRFQSWERRRLQLEWKMKRMDVEVDWESDNDTCDTGEEHSDDSSHISERMGRKASLQLEVEEDYSPPSSPARSLAGPSVRQELPVELQCEEEETYENYYQKRDSTTTAVFVTSSTNFDLQCEDEDLELYSSEHSEEPQGGLSEDDENIILIDAFGEEDLEPISGEALPYRCKKCGLSFQDLGELQEHKQIHLTEHSYRCPICGKEFFRAANLRMHKLIHSSDRPHKCPECDKGFIRTADVWRHLRNVHKIERSKMLGNGMVRNPWSSVHQNQNGGGDTYQQCSDDQKPGGEQPKPYICPTCGKGFHKPNLLSKHKVGGCSPLRPWSRCLITGLQGAVLEAGRAEIGVENEMSQS